jgi:hypothetical protein
VVGVPDLVGEAIGSWSALRGISQRAAYPIEEISDGATIVWVRPADDFRYLVVYEPERAAISATAVERKVGIAFGFELQGLPEEAHDVLFGVPTTDVLLNLAMKASAGGDNEQQWQQKLVFHTYVSGSSLKMLAAAPSSG